MCYFYLVNLKKPKMKTQFEHKDYSQLSTDDLMAEFTLVCNRMQYYIDNGKAQLTSVKKLGVLFIMFDLILTQIKIREPDMVNEVLFNMSIKNTLNNLNINLDEQNNNN